MKYRISYETKTPFTREDFIMLAASQTEEIAIMLENLGLPVFSNENPVTFIRDVHYQGQDPDIDRIKAFLKKSDRGYVKFCGWDMI